MIDSYSNPNPKGVLMTTLIPTQLVLQVGADDVDDEDIVGEDLPYLYLLELPYLPANGAELVVLEHATYPPLALEIISVDLVRTVGGDVLQRLLVLFDDLTDDVGMLIRLAAAHGFNELPMDHPICKSVFLTVDEWYAERSPASPPRPRPRRAGPSDHRLN